MFKALIEASVRFRWFVVLATAIVAAFGLYMVFGHMAPGIFEHRGFGLSWTVDHLYYTKEGVFGIPLGVSATYIFVFVLLVYLMVAYRWETTAPWYFSSPPRLCRH